MKRRQFIQQSALTAISIAVPWSKTFAQTQDTSMDKYVGSKTIGEGPNNIHFQVLIYNAINTTFETATAEHKVIQLTAFNNLKNKDVSQSYQASLKIKSIVPYKNKQSGLMDDFKIETSLLQTIKKEIELPKDLNIYKLNILLHEDLKQITLLDKKNNPFITLSISKEEEDDCFLTTACVSILGKPDNCTELSMLRKFRDEILKSSVTGKKLIKDYYEIAPQIVKAIALKKHQKEIYTEIYQQMIVPTLACINHDDHRGAISIYKNYTLKLKETYL